MTKLFYSIMVCAIGISMSACSNSSDQKIRELEEKIARMEEAGFTDPSDQSYLGGESDTGSNDYYTDDSNSYMSNKEKLIANAPGTYEFTDEVGHNWVLILNRDKTATITTKGSDYKAYGSWEEFCSRNIWVKFMDETPMIWFKSGEERGYGMHIEDGYIYESNNDADAKNPRKRLAIKKVK